MITACRRTAKVLFAIGLALPLVAQSPSDLPDPALTPGATATQDASQVCVVGYAPRHRAVSYDRVKQVYRRYGLQYRRGAAETDHLIPLELGGSNSVLNLWPQPRESAWSAGAKDALENRLHELVCYQGLPLTEAQSCIASNWISCYRSVFGTKRPRFTHNAIHEGGFEQ